MKETLFSEDFSNSIQFGRPNLPKWSLALSSGFFDTPGTHWAVSLVEISSFKDCFWYFCAAAPTGDFFLFFLS